MEEVRKIGKRGQVVYVVSFEGREYKRYPAGKHPNYYYCKWKKDGVEHSIRLHHAVWEKAHGMPVPEGYAIHHKDFNPLNNEPENLQLVTNREHSLIHRNLVKYNNEHPDHQQKVAYSKENWAARRAVAIERLQEKPRICEQCGKEFIATNVHQRFCSKSCYRLWQLTSPDCDADFVCEWCGKTFRANKYRPHKSCSSECAHNLTAYKRNKGNRNAESGGI